MLEKISPSQGPRNLESMTVKIDSVTYLLILSIDCYLKQSRLFNIYLMHYTTLVTMLLTNQFSKQISQLL